MATFLLLTNASREAPKMRVLDKVPCICYPVQFRKDKGKDILALLDSKSKINAMTPVHAAHLGLKVKVSNVGMQKIVGSLLAIYSMVIITFQVVNKLVCSWFCQETFLLADIDMEVVSGMLFLTLNNANVQFAEKKLT